MYCYISLRVILGDDVLNLTIAGPDLRHGSRGAVNNGATEIEIRETLLQAAVYCGAPTGMASFRTAEATIQTLKEEGKISR